MPQWSVQRWHGLVLVALKTVAPVETFSPLDTLYLASSKNQFTISQSLLILCTPAFSPILSSLLQVTLQVLSLLFFVLFPAAPEPECGESGSSAVAAGLGGVLAVVIVIGAVIVVALVIVIVILLRKLGRAEELLGEPPKTTKRYIYTYSVHTHLAYLVCRMCVECAK